MNRLQSLKTLLLVGALSIGVAAGTVEEGSMSSTATGQTINYFVYLPTDFDPNATEKYSCIFLLHWWIHTANAWHVSDGHRVNPMLDQMIDSVDGIICIAPKDPTPFTSGTGTSWWVDSPVNASWKYSTMLADELTAEVETKYNAANDRSHRGLCGPSMGGFGTLHNLRVQADVFGLGYALVPSTNLALWMNQYGLQLCIGNSNLTSYSPQNHINDYKGIAMKLAIMTGDCRDGCPGAETAADFFRPEILTFHNDMVTAGVDHVFNDYGDVGHDYPSPTRMLEILRFFETNFGTVDIVARPGLKMQGAKKAGLDKHQMFMKLKKNGVSQDVYTGLDGRIQPSKSSSGMVIKTSEVR